MSEKEDLSDLGVDIHITESTRVAKRPAPAEPAPRARASIRIVTCPDQRQVDGTFALRTDDVRIGRADGFNTFSINDPDVSREHLALIWRKEGYVLSDLQSTNGTMVNGATVQQEVALYPGDTILVGSTALKYERA